MIIPTADCCRERMEDPVEWKEQRRIASKIVKVPPLFISIVHVSHRHRLDKMLLGIKKVI